MIRYQERLQERRLLSWIRLICCWLPRKHGSMSSLDKFMDADTTENHAFLKTVERLVKLKESNPKVRLSGAHCLRETIVVTEEEKVGLRGPKRKFLELSKYEQRFGPAPSGKIKTITWKGQKLRGVDVINEEDESCHLSLEGVYEYIEESAKMLGRHTELNEPELDIGGNENIFTAALQQIQSGAASSSGEAVTIATSHAPPESTSKPGKATAAKETTGASEQDLFFESDDDDDEDTQPFAKLFARVSAAHCGEPSNTGSGVVSGPTPKAHAKPPKVVTTANQKPRQAKNTNAANADKKSEKGDVEEVTFNSDEEPIIQEPKPKRAKSAKAKAAASANPPGDHAEAPPVTSGGADDKEMSQDDREVMTRFENLVQESKDMVPDTKDDAAFAQWAKDSLGLGSCDSRLERVSTLTELRNNIQTKQKSLKRRRGESAFCGSTLSLKQGLQSLIEELSNLIDLTKRLSACATSEGKNLYDDIAKVEGLTVGREVWKRTMKAWTAEAGAGSAWDGCSERPARLEKTGLCDPNISFQEVKDHFTAAHGKLVNTHYTFLSTTSFKCLKGAERESVTKLQETTKAAAQVIVGSFIHNDFLPYMSDLESGFTFKKANVNPVLADESCLCQLQGGVLGNGSGNVIETFKEFSVFMKDLATTAASIFDDNGIEAVKAQAWVRKWQSQSGLLLKAVAAFDKMALGSPEEDTTTVNLTCNLPPVPYSVAQWWVLLATVCRLPMIRKGVLDNMETCVQDIFGEQLAAKAAECAKPGLDLLLGFLEDEGFLTKERFAEFKKSHEEACLIATALPNGDSFRGALGILSELVGMAFLLYGPEKDAVTTKYAFIKQANACGVQGDAEVKDALAEVAKITQMSENPKVLELAHLHGKFLEQSKEMFAQIRDSFIQKLDAALVKNADIPGAVDGISTLDAITPEFLESSFSITTSSEVSDKTIAMSTLLRDVKVAASFMAVKPEDFVETKDYELNNREGLTFLCLASSISGCRGFY
eukprot:s158_g25.t1